MGQRNSRPLDPERWRQVDELYHSAFEREPGQRSELLAEACQRDDELRWEVESLLAQASRNGILDREAAELLSDWPVRHLAAGSQLGPYRIEGILGAGGRGLQSPATHA